MDLLGWIGLLPRRQRTYEVRREAEDVAAGKTEWHR